jgi:SAM-dependent methyltransferase
LGTIYSADVDLLIVAKNKHEYHKYGELFKQFDTSSIVATNPNDMTKYKYKFEWFTYRLPMLVGAESLYSVLIDPRFHFYFMGIKCIDIWMNIHKSASRSHPNAMTDLFLLHKINNIPISENVCIKTISIRQGKAGINRNNNTEFNKRIKKNLKMWYDYDVSLNELDKHFKRCDLKFSSIYRRIQAYKSPIIKIQVKLHRKISHIYVKKYGKDVDKLLDIGCGSLSGGYIYKLLNIKNVYGIEPSIYSLKLAQAKSKTIENVKFTLHHGNGQDYIDFGKTFPIITINFAIHYMIDDLEKLIANLSKWSNNGTYVIITCINGNKVLQNLQNDHTPSPDKRFELKFRNDIYWGAYQYKDPIGSSGCNLRK